MKLQVKNLGPIKHGEIDLDKRFYVFVGYNNSGKTYMANLVYAYVSNENFMDFEWKKPRFSDYTENKSLKITEEYLINLFETYNDYVSDVLKIN